MRQQKIPLVCVVGPTASGKTSLAVALAKRLNGEVISADSMQIYQGMAIGTAKPGMDEMGGVPHHLIDFLDPRERFSVADFVALAALKIQEITQRGRLPLIAGGTGLYVQSLIDGLVFAEEDGDPQIRAELSKRIALEGPWQLLSELRAVDPQAAEKIPVGNQKRLVRALEVYYSTGVTFTEQNRRSREAGSPYDPKIIGLGFQNRERLYERIDRRVDRMMDEGLLEEAERVLNSLGVTASGAIGYKEFAAYFSGEQTLEEAVERLKRDTRRYAKRQLTWFKRDQRTHWIFVDQENGADGILQNSLAYLKNNGIMIQE